MSLKHGLLGLLNYGDMTGYELNKAFVSSINMFWKAQKSQIYRELTNMEKLEWLESETKIQYGKPNKKIYRITDKGKEEFLNWINTNQSKHFFINRNGFLMMLFFSGEKTVDENLQTLKRFRSDCIEHLNDLLKANENADYYDGMVSDKYTRIYWDMVIDFGASNMKMTLKWIDNCIAKLEGMK